MADNRTETVSVRLPRELIQTIDAEVQERLTRNPWEVINRADLIREGVFRMFGVMTEIRKWNNHNGVKVWLRLGFFDQGFFGALVGAGLANEHSTWLIGRVLAKEADAILLQVGHDTLVIPWAAIQMITAAEFKKTAP